MMGDVCPGPIKPRRFAGVVARATDGVGQNEAQAVAVLLRLGKVRWSGYQFKMRLGLWMCPGSERDKELKSICSELYNDAKTNKADT